MTVNSRSAWEPAAVFRFDEFTFDCGSRLLLRARTELHLSPKAQQLLHLLLLARPRVLSREELYDALWPSTFVCETNLASIVNEVRRTLDDDARACRYIRTVHGFGYSFCGNATSSAPACLEAAIFVCGGKSYLLHDGENTVGRAPDSGVVIAADTISRRHALITIEEGVFTIQDLDSRNGTFVDGQRIGRSPVILTPHSQISLGVIVATITRRKLSSTSALRLNMTELRRRVADRLAGVRSEPHFGTS